MERFDEVELLFIRETLDQHGEYLVDILYDSIVEKNLRVSDELLNSIEYKTDYASTNPKLSVTFLSYGRAIEINYHKKTRFEASVNRDIWGVKENRQTKKKKNTQFYSRNVYGSLNRLISILSNEYTDAEKERLKQILSLQNQRSTL